MKEQRNSEISTQASRAQTPFFGAQKTRPFISSAPAKSSFFVQRDGETEGQQSERDREIAAAEQAMTGEPSAPAAAPQTEPAQQESAAESSTSHRNYLGELIGGLVEGQIGDAGLRGHINTLAGQLQSLAENDTDDAVFDPDRLAALGVDAAFRNSATAIINDPGLRAVRQAIIETITEHDEVALVTALAAGIAAYLLDVDLAGSPELNLGRGTTVGADVDAGSIQSVEFKKLHMFFQYANEYFQARSTGGLRREVSEPDPETGDSGGEESFIGTAAGQIRVGTDLVHLRGSFTMATDGTAIFAGRISAGHDFGGGNRFVLTTDVSHNVGDGETTVRPGLEGRFDLGNNQSLRIGAMANVSSLEGLEGLSGHIEYRRTGLQLRLEANMDGVDVNRSIAPQAGPMLFQATLGVEF